MKFIIGQKIGMTRVFDAENKVTPVTLVEANKNTITQVKYLEKDGYQSFQVAYKTKKREFRKEENEENSSFKIGDTLKVSQFGVGEEVNVRGVSKGKGFSGTVKRYGFKIGPKTHGSNNQRKPGSIGATTPQHVIKGKRMAGRMGGRKVTVKKIKIIDIFENKNVLALKGSLPGPNGSILQLWTS